MRPTFVRLTTFIVAVVASHPEMNAAPATFALWLDEPTIVSWNKPGMPIPAAPRIQGTLDPRCKDQIRPPQVDEDVRVRDQGWDLIGAFQGGWQMVVIRGTAGYDGMCRPRRYQDFVFLRGTFAGTLSPQAMASRTDGALSRVSLQSNNRLMAEYQRYAPADPLCCPSRTTTVVFEVSSETRLVRPVSASTSEARRTAHSTSSKPLHGT